MGKRIPPICIIIAFLLLANSLATAEELNISVKQIPLDSGDYILFNITLKNTQDSVVYLQDLRFEDPTISNRQIIHAPNQINSNKEESITAYIPKTDSPHIGVVLEYITESEPTNEKYIKHTVELTETQSSKSMNLIFIIFGYVSLGVFILCLFFYPREEYLLRLFALLLAIANLTTAMIEFIFNLGEGAYFIFMMLTMGIISISIWFEKIPERYLVDVPTQDIKKEYLKEWIKSNYTKWGFGWFSLILIELLASSISNMLKPTIAIFYLFLMLLFIIAVFYIKGITKNTSLNSATCLLIALFVLNQLNSPIFEPQLNLIEVKHNTINPCTNNPSRSCENGQIEIEVKPAFFGFLTDKKRITVFNQAELSIPADYFIQDYFSEKPCDIRINSINAGKATFLIGTHSSKNRACKIQLAYSKDIVDSFNNQSINTPKKE